MMDKETGEIMSNEDFRQKLIVFEDDSKRKKFVRKHVEMKIPPTSRQLKRMKVGRNELCPCGSGKKFKKCCLDKNNILYK